MDDLFRWMVVRPAQTADPDATISLVGPAAAEETSFQARLADAKNSSSEPWEAMVAVAAAYEASAELANPIGTLAFGDRLQIFADKVAAMAAAAPSPNFLEALELLISTVFDRPSAKLVAHPDFQRDWERICNSIVALFITPAPGRALLGPLARLRRAIDLIQRVARSDAAIGSPGALAEALARSLLLPPAIFPLNPGLLKPVGIADLQVVRQRLTRYELADISTIENVLQGETKKHVKTHTLTTERDTTTEIERTTVTEDETQSDERFDLKREASKILKEDLGVKAGVNASYKYSEALTINANAEVSYDRAQSDSIKASVEYAKDVTARAATRITERVLARETRKVTEMFEARDEHAFSAKSQNNVGVYQFVNKVYTAQVFNYGKRLLFDITVPEPAVFYLDARSSPPEDSAVLQQPDPFRLTPHELAHELNPDGSMPENYYQHFLVKYQVSGFETAPPAPLVTTSAAISHKAAKFNEDPPLFLKGDALTIPPGYRVKRLMVYGGYHPGKGVKDDQGTGSGWLLSVGPFTVALGSPKGTFVYGFDHEFGTVVSPSGSRTILIEVPEKVADQLAEVGQIPWTISARLAVDFAVTVEAICEPTPAALHTWKLKAHAAIVEGYNKQLRDYRDQDQQRQFAAQATLGGNPDALRAIERTELKRAAVQMLSGRDLVEDSFDAIRTDQKFDDKDERPYPRAKPAEAEAQGRFIRFFEQAFEWDQMTYVFYPYAWGRPSTWYDKALLRTDDRTFGDFLRAGEARVVVPVRPGFEADVWYYLMTSQIWGGGDLPSISDGNYLSITEEIKSATGAPGDEKPQGDSWDVRLPTQLIRIRDDGDLPVWTKTGDPWTWTST